MITKTDRDAAPPTEASAGEAAAKEGSQPADAAVPRPDTDKEADQPTKEPGVSMYSTHSSHVHAPHGGIHNWRDFLVHIAVVTIGLLLAVGLEQTVEAVHHAHQRAQLEEQIRDTLENNSKLSSYNLQKLADYRAYLAELQFAVAARLRGQAEPRAPGADDPRRFQPILLLPRLGPYDASQADGSVALLGPNRIRIYTRLGAIRAVMQGDFERALSASSALRAFRKRFDPTPSKDVAVVSADITELSTPQLLEYQTHLGEALEAIDMMTLRLRAVDAESQAILGGARDESELMDAAKAVLLEQ